VARGKQVAVVMLMLVSGSAGPQALAAHLYRLDGRAWPGPWSGFMKNDEAGC
jgi:hypothetical protein